jgi:peptidoglycan L-alanyl-D-glutamate endopeptidase CwlK
MSRSLDELHPEVRRMFDAFAASCFAESLDILVTCTWRSPAEQDRLYAQGRTTPGKIVTNARAGQSSHNFTLNGKPASLAFDIVPLDGGKPIWAVSNPVWQRLGQLGTAAGLEWAGNWKRFREFPHFQHPLSATIRKEAT